MNDYTKIIFSQKLLVYQKVYDLLLLVYPLINKIPKFHKQVLGKYILEIGIYLLILIVKANKERSLARRDLQQEISDNLDYLRILIRLAKDLRFISVKNYLTVAEKINEIGRMLSSWMKA